MSNKYRWLFVWDDYSVTGTNTRSVMEEFLESISVTVIDTQSGMEMGRDYSYSILEQKSDKDDYDDSDEQNDE